MCYFETLVILILIVVAFVFCFLFLFLFFSSNITENLTWIQSITNVNSLKFKMCIQKI